MQKAMRYLGKDASFEEKVATARKVFAALPPGNRLKEREEDRWAAENQRDATFADMYLHPQEIDYTVPDVFDLVKQTGLEFLGFSNPKNFDLARILGHDAELLAKACALPERERLELVELLDPESVTHFEFFLSNGPLPIPHPADPNAPSARMAWTDDAALREAAVVIGPCMNGRPGRLVFDRDYMPARLSEEEDAVLTAVEEGAVTVKEALEKARVEDLGVVRRLVDQTMIILTPAGESA
mmetsp:Transcript_17658/g.44867  ORF Transcript_17658/g.44867 Transcript_17658/m.44867 type:complete len:241 (-) Transcript_17658:1092-1814(-)